MDTVEWSRHIGSKVAVYKAIHLGHQNVGPTFCMLCRCSSSQPTRSGAWPSGILNLDCESQHRLWGSQGSSMSKLQWDILSSHRRNYVDGWGWIHLCFPCASWGKPIALSSVDCVSVQLMRPGGDAHYLKTQQEGNRWVKTFRRVVALHGQYAGGSMRLSPADIGVFACSARSPPTCRLWGAEE